MATEVAEPLPAERAPAAGIAAEIAEQTERAVERDLPVFLLVLYRHEAEKLDFLVALREELRRRGLHSRTFDPRHRPEHGAGRLYAELADAGERTLSLVTEVPREPGGDGVETDFLRYLNLHRDRIGRERLRWVLLLHDADAEDLIHTAGDLWAVRQHTFWLEQEEGRRGERVWAALEDKAPALALPEPDREAIAEHVAEVRQLMAETPEAEGRAALLLDLSGWLERRYAAAEAAEVALEGLAEAPEEARELRAELEQAAASALSAGSHFSEALSHLENWLELRRQVGDRGGESATLNNIGRVYDDLGRKLEALERYQQALTIAREVGDWGGESATLNNIAKVYNSLGRKSEALKQYQQALAISREIGNRGGEATALNNIAKVYYDLGRKSEALEQYQQALTIFREVDNRRAEATTLNNIAEVYDALGRKSEALEQFQQALAIRREVLDRGGEGQTLNNIATVYEDLGRRSEALEQYQQSLAILREVGDRWSEAVTLFNVGSLLQALGQAAEAVTYLEQCVALDEELGHPDLESDRAKLAEVREQALNP